MNADQLSSIKAAYVAFRQMLTSSKMKQRTQDNKGDVGGHHHKLVKKGRQGSSLQYLVTKLLLSV
jgi:hypothetical protein